MLKCIYFFESSIPDWRGFTNSVSRINLPCSMTREIIKIKLNFLFLLIIEFEVHN